MLNVWKILCSSLLLGVMLTVTSFAQPVSLTADELVLLQKDKPKQPEKPVEREKKDDRRDERRDDKKDDKRKKPDEYS